MMTQPVLSIVVPVYNEEDERAAAARGDLAVCDPQNIPSN